jgi:hypothetical protein
MTLDDLQKARRHLIMRRGHYVEQLAKGPVVIDDLVRWLFDTQRAIDILDKLELNAPDLCRLNQPEPEKGDWRPIDDGDP